MAPIKEIGLVAFILVQLVATNVNSALTLKRNT